MPVTAPSGMVNDKVYSFLPSVPVCPAVNVTEIESNSETDRLYPSPVMLSAGNSTTEPSLSVISQPRNTLSVFGVSLNTVCCPIG